MARTVTPDEAKALIDRPSKARQELKEAEDSHYRWVREHDMHPTDPAAKLAVAEDYIRLGNARDEHDLAWQAIRDLTEPTP